MLIVGILLTFYKGEGMKTFNIMRLVVVVALAMSLSASANLFNSCGRSCAPKCEKSCEPCAGKACTLKPALVDVEKCYTCGKPGYYRQVCRLEYRPCVGEERREIVKMCPVFEGCFEEGTGRALDDTAARNGGAGYTQDGYTNIEATAVPVAGAAAYTASAEPVKVKKTGKRMHKKANQY
jgi:hypothetical protein